MNVRHALPIALALLTGCDDSPGPATPPARIGAPAAKAPTPAVEPADPGGPREILGRRTQDVRDAEKEMRTTSAVKAPPRAVARDPITLSGNAYVTAVGQTAIGNIRHAVDLYQAETGEYPKTYQEFMDQIIKKNNIALPVLPYYQEYGYDAAHHQLIVLEYPDKKAAGDARHP